MARERIGRVLSIVALTVHLAAAAQHENDYAAFERAVASYMAVYQEAALGLPPASDPEQAVRVATSLSERIREQRQDVKPGAIFGTAERAIRDVIAREMDGPRGRSMAAAINDSNVFGARVRVNHRYPPGLPRATMPGALLSTLPLLPAELEYRFLGRSLLLVDSRAQLIVDILPDALPQGH